MRVCVVGGALQGMEAVYLSRKAGYETIVIDKRKDAPAFSLSDEYEVIDPVTNIKDAMRIFSDCDHILPACENIDLLSCVSDMIGSEKLLFDIDSYRISSSKNASNRIMGDIGIPMPADWPDCGFPVVVKPSSQSGSVGVTIANNNEEVSSSLERIKEMGDEPVIQSFVSGKGVSMEVIGNGRTSQAFFTTEIITSADHDCKRVLCNKNILSAEAEGKLREISERIADKIRLRSLMDIEAIDTADGLKVLEIDARIPSQTPAAVLAATGTNLLKEMVNSRSGRSHGPSRNIKASSYEHFFVENGKLETSGEKKFAHVRSPKIEKGLFGADEMITDYENGIKNWRATMIITGKDEWDVDKKRCECIRRIMDECGLKRFVDPSPEAIR